MKAKGPLKNDRIDERSSTSTNCQSLSRTNPLTKEEAGAREKKQRESGIPETERGGIPTKVRGGSVSKKEERVREAQAREGKTKRRSKQRKRK